MKRILIIGPSASGKSTFARALAAKYNLTALHQDVFFFTTDNTPHPHATAISNMQAAAPANGWVIEGNYNQVLNAFLPAADTVIFLDFNRISSLYRVFKRRLTEHADPALTPGGQHRVPLHFITYILFIYPKVQRQQRARLRQHTPPNLKECKTFRQFLSLQKTLLS